MNSDSVAAVGVELQELSIDDREFFPERPGALDCSYFLRTGTCAYGRNCRYNHPRSRNHEAADELPERPGAIDCAYYLRTGFCKYGGGCKYNHPKNRHVDVPMNALGLPMRQGVKPCPYYMMNETCYFGCACKFDHPPPLSELPTYGFDQSMQLQPPPFSSYYAHCMLFAEQPRCVYYYGAAAYGGGVCQFDMFRAPSFQMFHVTSTSTSNVTIESWTAPAT